ncbi:hypothetical protein SASPL_103072 [Salvia splendens]|uniref:Uncharacterized protein n=1 Tax=Salvia splendens TaxID=180675 RepID=A0A8X8YX95_SALSN|nr:hypothetical protein SASPL_103072 [Salvia splendens]
MAKEQDMLNWDKEMKQAEEDLVKMMQQLQTKLETATVLLRDLKSELATYLESEESGKAGHFEDVLNETEKSNLGQLFPQLRRNSKNVKEQDDRDKMVDLPKNLRKAEQEKSLAQTARDELRKAKEEAELAKAGGGTVESRLRAANKEIEAARASENQGIVGE